MRLPTYENHLATGEIPVPRQPAAQGSMEWQYDYTTIAIDGNQQESGNSVLLDVAPGGAVEPVSITDFNLTLRVKTLQGEGYAVVDHGPNAFTDDASLHLLRPGATALSLLFRDTYFYLNPSKGRLVLRDDATPAFTGSEETSLFEVPKNESGLPIPNKATSVSREFLVAFGALKNLAHDQLKTREQVIPGAIYSGNHGIQYKVLGSLASATGYEQTGAITTGVHYIQLTGGACPSGTEWWRSEAEFLRGTEQIDGQKVPIFRLASMPLTQGNLELITGA